MIEFPDVNVLLALHVAAHQFHTAAATWLAQVEAFATTPITEAGLVRLLLQPRFTGSELSATEALGILRRLKAQPHTAFIPDASALDTSHFSYALTGPKQVTDIHLLDLARSRGGRLVTFDAKITAALKPRDRKHIRVLAQERSRAFLDKGTKTSRC